VGYLSVIMQLDHHVSTRHLLNRGVIEPPYSKPSLYDRMRKLQIVYRLGPGSDVSKRCLLILEAKLLMGDSVDEKQARLQITNHFHWLEKQARYYFAPNGWKDDRVMGLDMEVPVQNI
jgi:hypothetical protein